MLGERSGGLDALVDVRVDLVGILVDARGVVDARVDKVGDAHGARAMVPANALAGTVALAAAEARSPVHIPVEPGVAPQQYPV